MTTACVSFSVQCRRGWEDLDRCSAAAPAHAPNCGVQGDTVRMACDQPAGRTAASRTHLADALAAATPGGLEHDGVADAVAALERLGQVVDAGAIIHVWGDHAVGAGCRRAAAEGGAGKGRGRSAGIGASMQAEWGPPASNCSAHAVMGTSMRAPAKHRAGALAALSKPIPAEGWAICPPFRQAPLTSIVHRDAVAAPGQRGHPRRLRQDGGPDLVAQGRHGGGAGPQEADGGGGLLQRLGQLGLLRGVAPRGGGGRRGEDGARVGGAQRATP